jgi:hypothetical protein
MSRIACSFTALLLLLAVLSSACQQAPATNSNTSANTTNINANTSTSNANANAPDLNGSAISTHEPDKYSATITLKLETQGEGQTASTPPLAAEFAKNGADRRVSIKLGNEQVVFLDSGGKRYIISENRKQYAELTPESTGFEVPTVMTPGQIINSIKGMKNCERQGEEQMNGRTAIKYRCAGQANTGTQAGQVTTEAFIYIDKETELPLHSESFLTASGNVQGVKGLKVVTELSNLKTDADPTLFAEPKGMSKVAPEQVRQQVDLIVRAALAFAGQIMSNTGTQPNSSASPAASTSPSASPAR